MKKNNTIHVSKNTKILSPSKNAKDLAKSLVVGKYILPIPKCQNFIPSLLSFIVKNL